MTTELDISLEEKLVRATHSPMIEKLEREMLAYPPVECPLTHQFFPGLYVRNIFMPRGSVITSKVHRWTHPFFVMWGKMTMVNEGEEAVLIQGPYRGITQAGTVRALLIHEDTFMSACYATTLTDLKEIEALIIEPREIIKRSELPL